MRIVSAVLLGMGTLALTTADVFTARSTAVTVRHSNVVDGLLTTSVPTLVSTYVVAKGGAHTMVLGSTLQFLAYGVYSDGSVDELPDSQGDSVTGWNTSNHSVAKISTRGHATALGVGSVDIEATVGAIGASPWELTVSTPPVPIPPTISCSSNPSLIGQGQSAIITATGGSPRGLTLTYSYSASAGAISGTNTTETLKTPVTFEGAITVTCTVDEQGGGSASATTNIFVATSSGNLDDAANWESVHDSGTPGESRGSSAYPATVPPYDDARKFYMTYSGHGGERFSLSFGTSTVATHFVYDTYVYLVDPSEVHNVEMDINQVMSNGQTVIFGAQCSASSGRWEYTTDIVVDGKRKPHWSVSNILCNPTTWTANSWHHVQIASYRDASGNVTYSWLNLDGTTTNFVNASGLSALNLGWEQGDLSLNLQLDGASEGSGSITAYIDDLTIYRW
jgi:Bacterial Ig-like domain (group 2)